MTQTSRTAASDRRACALLPRDVGGDRRVNRIDVAGDQTINKKKEQKKKRKETSFTKRAESECARARVVSADRIRVGWPTSLDTRRESCNFPLIMFPCLPCWLPPLLVGCSLPAAYAEAAAAPMSGAPDNTIMRVISCTADGILSLQRVPCRPALLLSHRTCGDGDDDDVDDILWISLSSMTRGRLDEGRDGGGRPRHRRDASPGSSRSGLGPACLSR